MLRKGEDSGASSILYRMVSQGQGKNIWYKFIKKALVARRVPNMEDLNSDNFEDIAMHFLLYDWVQTASFKEYMETFRESLDESKT